ncbi:MAG: carboxypeptidase-like regulatory domain-containing protein [Muribaculaceae bacterium]|nr:carboxypeptidase-like regulatory domain-containing protein [Muribaculaceae bacterium]
MKKFYSYGLAVLMTLTATAASGAVLTRTASAEPVNQPLPCNSPLSTAKVEPVMLESSNSFGTMAWDFNRLNSAASLERRNTPKRVAPATRATEIGDTWKSVGTAKYTDGIVCAIYNVKAETWDVELEQNEAAEGVYRLVNPYTCGTSPYSVYNNSNDDNYMVFDATNPQAVVLIPSDSQNYRTDLCVTLNDSDGPVFVVPSEWWGGDETGTFGDGIINFPAGTLGVYMPDFNPQNCYNSKPITVLLPGAKDYAISVENLTGTCTENGKIRFSYEKGTDATNVKCFFTSGKFPANQDNLNFVASNGLSFTYDDGTYTYTCTEEGWYTLFFVSLDSNGNVASSGCICAYNRIFNPDNWTSLGMGVFSDDTFAPSYGITAKIPAYNVEILESKTTPGVYCLVNPYKDHPALREDFLHSHNDYLVVNASNPKAVVIDEQPIGVNIGSDDLTLYSLQDGTLANHVITFPTRGLVYGDGEGYYYANRSGNFSITIPYFELTVKVTDADGVAISDATVSILNVNDADAVTDAEGVAAISFAKALEAGSYILTAYKDGYEMDDTTPVTIDVKDGEFVYNASITLDAAVCTATFRVSSQDEPVEGASIKIEGLDPVVTNVNGEAIVAIKGGFGNSYDYTISKDGFEDYSGVLEFNAETGYEAYPIIELTPTGTRISEINADAAAGNAVIYNLQGIRLYNVNATGCYIINGKKVMVVR